MKKSLLVVAVFISAVLSVSRADCDELTNQKCQILLNEITEGQSGLWRTIPWETNLLEAQRKAVEQRKPIFIWAMDGHPLGCT